MKQIEKKVFSSPFRKWGFGMWPMKNGVKMKMAWAVFYSYDCIGGAVVSLFSVNVNLVVYGSFTEVQYREQNHIIFHNPKTDFISITTHFAKQDNLQLTKVLKSYKLTDIPNFLLFTN